jgi:hypothetical protein
MAKGIKTKNYTKAVLIILILFLIALVIGLSGFLKVPVETTTTTIKTTIPTTIKTTIPTTVETTETTTTMKVVENLHDCKYARIRIESFKYSDGALKLYLKNVGSVYIYYLDVKLYYADHTMEKEFTNLNHAPKSTLTYLMNDAGYGVKNITVTIPDCGFSVNDPIFEN